MFTYGNGDTVSYTYDSMDRQTEKWFGDPAKKVRYYYTLDNSLGVISDEILNTHTRYTYDLAGRVVKEEIRENANSDTGALIRKTTYSYEDGTNRLLSRNDTLFGSSKTTTYVYGNQSQNQMVDAVYSVSYDGADSLHYEYDSLGRRTERMIALEDAPYKAVYTYLDGRTENETTTWIQSVWQDGRTTSYQYDNVGNIIEIAEDGEISCQYTYDDLNQMLTETIDGVTTTYTYDAGGNILSRTKEGQTDTWSYTDPVWKDLLTSYNGQTITYDEVGNPLSYRNGMTMSWTRGMDLSGITQGDNAISYTYDADGIRTSKTVNGATTTYILDGSTILGEKRSDGTTIRYLYDESGTPYAFFYNSQVYYYVYNAQGDVIEIMSTSGSDIATYKYDAWGNVIGIGGDESIAELNPIRYRGYYYDNETGFYYLNSRYYDPEIGRFINADSIVASVGGSVKGYNLFAYCFNNPLNMNDQTGNWPNWIKNTVKWVAKNIVKPVVKTIQNVLSKVNATYSRGINVSGTPSAFIFNLQAGISMDTKGNIAVQGSFGGGVTAGSPGASITAYQSITNAPNIHKLEGSGYQIGGSIGIPVYGVPLAAGGDFNIIPDSTLNTTYLGATANMGFGTPGGEIHVEWGETATWNAIHFNIFDVAENIYIKIMEW